MNGRYHVIVENCILDHLEQWKDIELQAVGAEQLKSFVPTKTTRTAANAAVAPNISFVRAAVVMIRANENTATNAAIIPSLFGVYGTAYKTAIPATGSRQATIVVKTFKLGMFLRLGIESCSVDGLCPSLSRSLLYGCIFQRRYCTN